MMLALKLTSCFEQMKMNKMGATKSIYYQSQEHDMFAMQGAQVWQNRKLGRPWYMWQAMVQPHISSLCSI